MSVKALVAVLLLPTVFASECAIAVPWSQKARADQQGLTNHRC